MSDVAKARRFYDAALAPLGFKCLSEDASALGYGGGDGPRLWLLAAGAAVPRNIPGLHICLEAGRRAAVDHTERLFRDGKSFNLIPTALESSGVTKRGTQSEKRRRKHSGRNNDGHSSKCLHHT
ncbi:MAG TPA: hypothetical protein VNF49_11755 [Candidatus Binataceae bacterium]|nr:hypothetical protein [Candidatus Binataceae bacterium]